jgi:hypothetical protein
MMDVLPTIASITAASPPRKRIDGHDITQLLLGDGKARSPYDETGFFYYHIKQLQARCVRDRGNSTCHWNKKAPDQVGKVHCARTRSLRCQERCV